MNKQELKALLMKIETMYDTAQLYTNLQPYNVYKITRHLIDMIEDNNQKVMVEKGKLHLVKPD